MPAEASVIEVDHREAVALDEDVVGVKVGVDEAEVGRIAAVIVQFLPDGFAGA